MQGYQYTWVKGRGTEALKEEWLDRIFATQDWLDMFPNNYLINGGGGQVESHTSLAPTL